MNIFEFSEEDLKSNKRETISPRQKEISFRNEMSAVFKEGEKYEVYYCRSGIY